MIVAEFKDGRKTILMIGITKAELAAVLSGSEIVAPSDKEGGRAEIIICDDERMMAMINRERKVTSETKIVMG